MCSSSRCSSRWPWSSSRSRSDFRPPTCWRGVNFHAKPVLLLLYFLPLLIPQMTYGIPLATTLYGFGVGGTVIGVILAVLVPMVPLAVFILLPFFEQISLNLEWSASDARREPAADIPPHPVAADAARHFDRRACWFS